MSEKYRTINTRFWIDGWVRRLNALDRYLFLYLITNDHVSWCGVYELELAMMAFESGIDKEDLQKTMLPRLSPKIIYEDGWVFIRNFPKYHSGGINAEKGLKAAIDELPDRIRARINDILSETSPEDNPLGGGSPSASASASASISAVKPREEIKYEPLEEKETRVKREPKDVSYRKVFGLWGIYPRNWNDNLTEIGAAKNILAEHGLEKADKALRFSSGHQGEEGCPQILKPSDLDRKWVNLIAFKKKLQ